MTEKIYETLLGNIHYWVNLIDKNKVTLVFLPGLTADHRLFEKQIEYFENKYNVFVWDAPAHASSWPFEFDFDLMDKARWLHEILENEQITKPILIVFSNRPASTANEDFCNIIFFLFVYDSPNGNFTVL